MFFLLRLYEEGRGGYKIIGQDRCSQYSSWSIFRFRTLKNAFLEKKTGRQNSSICLCVSVRVWLCVFVLISGFSVIMCVSVSKWILYILPFVN